MKIGPVELIVIFIVALLAIGPDKLPAYARKLGLALKEFRNVTADVTKDVRESVIEPLEEAQAPLRQAMEPLQELDKEVRGDLKDIEKDLKNIGKPKPEKPAAPAKAVQPEEAAPAAPPEDLPADKKTEEGENA